MKRRLLNFMVMLSFAVMLSLPANAAEYGVVYDETEQLYTDELYILGTETLPDFTENYGIDLRVDVLTGLGNYENVEETAVGLYENYGYGSGEGNHCVSLTILVNGNEDGYEVVDWYAYFAGDSSELTTNGPSNIFEVDQYLLDEAWSGNMEQDADALTNAVESFVTGLESFVLNGGVADTIWTPVGNKLETMTGEEEIITSLETGETVSATESADDAWMLEESSLDHVTDSYGILSEEQWQNLEFKAREIEEKYDFGVYAVVVTNYQDYTNGSVQDAAEAIYKRYSLGNGLGKDGLLLLLSMEDRDFNLLTHGNFGNYAFDDYGRQYMTELFLDNLADNDWYGGLTDYIDWSADYLEAAKSGTPYTYGHEPMTSSERMVAIFIRLAIIFLVPLAIAAIYISILVSKMKSVAEATKATAYVSGNLKLQKKIDRFVHATESRTKISSDSGSGSSGSSRSGGSGGFSGTSGKF